MSSKRERIGSVMRLLASGGWADQDTDVLMDLVRDARALASAVVEDSGASDSTRAAARRFLDQVGADLLDH